MKLFKYNLHITVNKVIKPVSDVIKIYSQYIPACMYKQAQVPLVLEQSINEVIPVYKEKIDYIVCQLRSTIQHEAQHRADELKWQKEDPEKRITFEEITDPTKAEINPERAEEQCIQPDVLTGQIEHITIYQLFEQAKTQANISSGWKNDIIAARLPEGVAGQYLMKSYDPQNMMNAEQIGDGVYKYGNKLLIDVRKQVMPNIVNEKQAFPPNVQTSVDGAVTQDTDLTRLQPGGKPSGTIPGIPSVPSIPSQ